MTTQLAEREVVPAGWGALGGTPRFLRLRPFPAPHSLPLTSRTQEPTGGPLSPKPEQHSRDVCLRLGAWLGGGEKVRPPPSTTKMGGGQAGRSPCVVWHQVWDRRTLRYSDANYFTK